MDFIGHDNSFLVDHQMTHGGPRSEVYLADGERADPSTERTAELMRRIYERPENATRIGARAQQDVALALSPEASEPAMRQRLEELAAGWRGPRRN